MKKLLFILLFLLSIKGYSQVIIQTYTDRCTNIVYTFTVTPNGQSVVTFYNRSQIFTAAQFTNGTLQAWLEQTYAWWAALNPCSAAQAESQTAQQTAQQTTQAATQAATNAAAAAPPPPPPATTTTNTTNTSTNATSNTAGTSSSSNTSSTGSTESSNTNSSSSTGSSGSGEGSSDSSGGSGEGGSSDTETKQEETKTEETKSEESKSEESSESEEKVEEEKKEESKEEESDSEEESEEESSEDSEEEKKEEEKKKEKKKNLAPPILAANLMGNQMLDGTWTTAASFGVSQSSLTGQETYSANAMIWSNLKQFSLSLSKSKVHFWKDKVSYTEVGRSGNKSKLLEGNKHKENLIHHVGSTSLNYMNIFGTSVVTAGYSHVILGQEDNFWKGFAGGYAAMGSLIVLPESLLLSPSLTFFGTKPVAFKALPRWGFAPMVAVSLSPIQLNNQDKKVNVVWNEYFNYIIGTNANFNLTQRFVANIGLNTINNTNPIIPTTLAVTIGARFAF